MSKSYKARPRHKQTALGQMVHSVVLCSAADVIDESGELRLSRTAAAPVLAAIDPKRGSLFSPDGQAIKETREQQSHVITLRADPEMLISSRAWVYEARGGMPPRWFKVLSVKDGEELGTTERFWHLSCRLVERTDEASRPAVEPPPCPPPSLAAPLPAGVKL